MATLFILFYQKAASYSDSTLLVARLAADQNKGNRGHNGKRKEYSETMFAVDGRRCSLSASREFAALFSQTSHSREI